MYNKYDFTEMIKDWLTDNAEEMDDLVVDKIEIDEDTQKWVAYAKDAKTLYSLSDNDGNIVLNYISSINNHGGIREGSGRPRVENKKRNRSIKFSDSEWLTIQAKATEQSKTVSEYIRNKALK